MILETSFILDLWAGDPAAEAKARELDARGAAVYVPAPFAFELWEGVALSDRSQEEVAKVRDFVSVYPALPFDAADAREAGALSGPWVRRGRRLGWVDAQIAGMAKVRGLPLLAADDRFGELTAELRVETYR